MSVFTVGSLDSGIGGLSVVSKIFEILPKHQYIHLADYKFFPYGNKPLELLHERLLDLVPKFVEKFDIDLLVLACNTASTTALSKLRKIVHIPIVGVVPAVKPAAQGANSIGIVATSSTIHSPYTHNLIKKFAHQCEVIFVGSNDLVLYAEQKLQGYQIPLHALQPILKPFLDKSCKNIVLACTHFPFLKQEFNHLLSPQTTLFDSGEAIARRVQYILNELPKTQKNLQPNLLLSSCKNFNFKSFNNSFKDFKFSFQYIDTI